MIKHVDVEYFVKTESSKIMSMLLSIHFLQGEKDGDYALVKKSKKDNL
jgi:hypothetical protein